jgi:hypothetical protein
VFEPDAAFFAEPARHLGTGVPEIGATVGAEEEVIDVAQVAEYRKGALDEVIEVCQIDVGGEELARVGPNRETPTP